MMQTFAQVRHLAEKGLREFHPTKEGKGHYAAQPAIKGQVGSASYCSFDWRSWKILCECKSGKCGSILILCTSKLQEGYRKHWANYVSTWPKMDIHDTLNT